MPAVEIEVQISLLWLAYPSGHADAADAGGHAARYGTLIHAGITGDTFFGLFGDAVEQGFFVGASFDTFLVSAATFLIDQDDAVFGSFVDSIARTSG